MKEKILNKAADLFLSYGFKSVTMDDIANSLGISKKTVYSHFQNKRHLVHDTTFYVFDQINEGICQICAGHDDPVRELYEIKSLVMEQLKGEKTSPHYQLQKYYPKIFARLKEMQFESINRCVIENLRRGMEDGFYRKDLDIDLIAKFYLNGNLGLMNLDLFPMDQNNMGDLKAAFLEYHIRAIATEKGLKSLYKLLEE
jgi:AcrR family transcriptional regulator